MFYGKFIIEIPVEIESFEGVTNYLKKYFKQKNKSIKILSRKRIELDGEEYAVKIKNTIKSEEYHLREMYIRPLGTKQEVVLTKI